MGSALLNKKKAAKFVRLRGLTIRIGGLVRTFGYALFPARRLVDHNLQRNKPHEEYRDVQIYQRKRKTDRVFAIQKPVPCGRPLDGDL